MNEEDFQKENQEILDWIDRLTDMIAEETAAGYAPTPLKSREQFQQAHKAAMQKGFDQYRSNLEHGVKLLFDAGKFPPCSDPEGCTKRFSDPKKLRKFLAKGHSIQECFGFETEGLAQAYEVATDYFSHDNFDHAADILLFLITIAPFIPCYWVALGMAEQRRGDLESASNAYLMGLEPTVPDLSPYLYAADCLRRIHSPDEAIEILEEAIAANKERSTPDTTFQKAAEKQLNDLSK
jgi:tetratricopeptide (TPR) repeat protein